MKTWAGLLLEDGAPTNEDWYWYTVLLMVQKSGKKPPGKYKTPVNNWIDYQAQLVIAGFLKHQQWYYSSQVKIVVVSESHVSLQEGQDLFVQTAGP